MSIGWFCETSDEISWDSMQVRKPLKATYVALETAATDAVALKLSFASDREGC